MLPLTSARPHSVPVSRTPPSPPHDTRLAAIVGACRETLDYMGDALRMKDSCPTEAMAGRVSQTWAKAESFVGITAPAPLTLPQARLKAALQGLEMRLSHARWPTSLYVSRYETWDPTYGPRYLARVRPDVAGDQRFVDALRYFAKSVEGSPLLAPHLPPRATAFIHEHVARLESGTNWSQAHTVQDWFDANERQWPAAALRWRNWRSDPGMPGAALREPRY